jgi:hypothetical protein
MKIKATLVAFLAFLLLGLSTSSSYAGTFLDDFDDGNADGWWLGYSIGQPHLYGNWRIENQTLAQDSGLDGVVALLENFQLSGQTVETDLKLNGPSGGGGITLWFQDNTTLVFVGLSNGTLTVAEVENGVWHSTGYLYPYSVNENKWVNLKVEANSLSGGLNVYIDNIYIFNHYLTTSHRIGQTGVVHGNAGGYFDNFMISASSIFDVQNGKDQCKKDGWKAFVYPTFKNQGNCIKTATKL